MTHSPSSAQSDLKPCPFCGERLEAWGVNYRHSIDSNCLLAFASVRVGPTEVKAWNRRAAASVQAPGQAVAWQVRRADGRIDGAPIQWENCTKKLYDATLETGRYAGYENGPRCEARALTVAAPSSAARETGDGVTKPTLSEDVLMQAIADTAARGHVWASRALSNFRTAVREATTSPNDA